MKKDKYTNIGYFFLEHNKHLETNKQTSPQNKNKKTKAKQQPPLFQITLLENCYYWRSHFRCKGICFISLRIWFEPWDPQWKEAADSWKLSFGLHTCAHSLCPMLPFSSLTHNNKIQLQKKHFPLFVKYNHWKNASAGIPKDYGGSELAPGFVNTNWEHTQLLESP